MKGADDYANVFNKPEQVGRLYLLPGNHARGKTFHIYLLPDDEAAVAEYKQNPPTNGDRVEIFGITGGQRGWTETYGWLHTGKWKEDFEAIYKARVAARDAFAAKRAERDKTTEVDEKARIQRLLADY